MRLAAAPPLSPSRRARRSAPVPAGAHRAMWYLNIYAAISGAQVILASLNPRPRTRVGSLAGNLLAGTEGVNALLL